MNAFGIFQGGGAKGIAHVGALRKAEDMGIEFIGVAGTSAGAIIAALIAAGYKADELFDLDKGNEMGKLDIEFLNFFDEDIWATGKKLIDDLKNHFSKAGIVRNYLTILPYYIKYRKLVKKIVNHHGLFKLQKFIEWMDQLLSNKVFKTDNSKKRVLFKDLEIPLKIIGSDLTNEEIFEFSQVNTPDFAVSEAVGASICIPIFFVPAKFKKRKLVDGGLLSNFPAWIFDRERQKEGPLVPTYGFKLVETPCAIGTKDKSSNRPDSETLNSFLRSLISTVLSGDEQLEIRNIENFHIIPIKVDIGTFDFDLSREKKIKLFNKGYKSAEEFFSKQIGTKRHSTVTELLKVLCEIMLSAIGKGELHVRSNIVIKTTSKTLRVSYTYNMENDTDDLLELKPGKGASGRCWENHDIVLCDMVEAMKNFNIWGMNKYQQAMVRPSLQSLMCIPVFEPEKFDKEKTAKENELIGVLSFDSDDDLFDDFRMGDVLQAACDCAALTAYYLKPGG